MLKAQADRQAVSHRMKAYMVSDDDEGRAVVVFAAWNLQARRAGARELGMDSEEVDSCRRAPEFDAYAEVGEVPPLVALAHGWWFECEHCGHKVDQDCEGPDGEELEPVADGQRVYCSSAHMMAEWSAHRARQARMNAVVEACALKFFGWPIFDLRGAEHYKYGGDDTTACCDFDFPGRKGLLARWDLGDAKVFISQCDREAWEAMKAERERHITSSGAR